MSVQARARPYRLVSPAMCSASALVRAEPSSRQRQLPLWVLGVLMRASGQIGRAHV